MAPLLHVLPVAALEVRTTLPPWHNVVDPAALITGADGTALGAATPVPAVLVHPFNV